MNRTKKNVDQPNTIEENDILLHDPLQIANAFNSYFVNIGPNLARQIKIPKHLYHKIYLKEKTNTFEFTKVNELEVNSIIDHLSPKACHSRVVLLIASTVIDYSKANIYKPGILELSQC